MFESGKCLGPGDGDKIAEMIRKLQPEIHIHGGTRPDSRWSGSEGAWAAYPLLNMIPKDAVPTWIPPYVHGWCPVEANIHTRNTWFWVPDSNDTLVSIDTMLEKYYQYLGRGANLLVNITPDTHGLVPDAEVERLAEFGLELNKLFGSPIASVDSKNRWSEGFTLELDLGKTYRLDYVVLEENIKNGQKIQEYVIELYEDGKWKHVTTGLTIGRKRIERLQDIVADRIRLRIIKSVTLPEISSLTVFGELC